MTITATYNQRKSMAISSITSPLNEISTSPSSPSSYHHPHRHHQDDYNSHQLISFVHYTNTLDTDEATATVNPPMAENKQQHQLQPPPIFSYSSSSESSSLSSSYTANGIERSPSPSPSSLHHIIKSGDENSSSSNTNNNNSALSPALHHFSSSSSSSVSVSGGPLSLQERRQRNKTASAKYRAKKNQQHQGMRAMIQSMTKENDLLLRQLEQAKSENRQLKSVCDKLRSKMMAEKMFKKMVYHQQHPHPKEQEEKNHHQNHAYVQTPPDEAMDDEW